MIERRSIFYKEVLFLLFFYIIFICLPIAELLPQHNEQFPSGPAPLYNVPEYTTQFAVIPEDRGQQIPLNDNTRALNNFNNFNTNDGDISSALPVDDHHRPRGQKSYFSGLAEELESAGIEDQDGEAIPGEAQQDYPVYEEIPRTGFSCRGRHAPAYYADVEARCQVFHICDVGGHKHSFLCPNGSVFNQKYLVCDWWYDFTCDNAENLFNKQIVPTEINSVSPSIPVSPNSIDSDRILLNNNDNNEGFQLQNSPNDYNNYQHNNNDGFIYNQEENRNGFNHPNTQIDIPQQIYTDNVYIPQNDIFHGAETGFPGRDLISQNSGNSSTNNINNNNNQNNINTINENSDKNNNERQDSNYNLQQTKYEQNNDKAVTKTNNEGSIQPNINNNANDNGIRKQLRPGRKGNDFSQQNRNTVFGNNNNNNKEQVNFQNNNNEEQVNLNQQGDQRNIINNNNLNNQNVNFQIPYSNGQFQQNHLQGNGNENYDGNKSPVHPSIQPQLNFAPPNVNL